MYNLATTSSKYCENIMKFLLAIFEKFRNSHMFKKAQKLDYFYQEKFISNNFSIERPQIAYTLIKISNQFNQNIQPIQPINPANSIYLIFSTNSTNFYSNFFKSQKFFSFRKKFC